jgi:hypothetical protein
MKKEGNVVISEGMKPLWKRVLAAAIFTLIFYLIIKFGLMLLEVIIILVSIALPLATSINHYFDFSNSKYKTEYSMGYIRYGSWQKLPNLEYASVFKNNNDYFELNLWYYKNRHFKIFNYYEYDDAISNAFNISEELNIDLLDASVKNNHRWIDRDIYRENKEIKYID